MFIPLLVDVNNWNVAIFGGGNVGLRRAKLFLDAGSKEVIVVADKFKEELIELSNKIERLKLVKAKVPENLEVVTNIIKDVDLVVIASSDEEANKLVRKIARTYNKLINDATDAKEASIIVPFFSSVLGGEMIIAVSSLGRAGVAARRTLNKIINCVENDVEIRTLYYVMRELKKYMKAKISDTRTRISLYFKISDDEIFNKYIKQGMMKEAYNRGLEIISEFTKEHI